MYANACDAANAPAPVLPMMRWNTIRMNLSISVERCPRGVEPAKIIEAVRLAVIRKQGNNHIKAEDIPCMAEDDDTPGQLVVSAFRKYKK